MSRNRHILSSSLGKKLIMSLTGLFLCTFLIVHLVGNLQLFRADDGKAFNEYAYLMTHFTPIKIVSYLLYLSFILHALYALNLTIQNKKARPIGYASYNGSANSKWTSRNMGLLGTIILVFLATHMSNFWWKYHNDQVPYIEYKTDLNTLETQASAISADEFTDYVQYVENGTEVLKARDLYAQVSFAFQEWYLVLFYVISMLALSFHLIHGFKSAFQTLGFNNKRYMPLVNFLGIWVMGVAVPAGFAAMPLYFFFVK